MTDLTDRQRLTLAEFENLQECSLSNKLWMGKLIVRFSKFIPWDGSQIMTMEAEAIDGTEYRYFYVMER